MRLQLSPGRRRLLVLCCAGLLVIGLLAGIGYIVGIERLLSTASDSIVVETDVLSPRDAVGVTLWMPAQPPRDVEPFGGAIYAATPTGLCVYDERGHLTRRFTTLDGLPENSLTCLERFDGKLYIGTERSGLLAYDGDRFVRFRFERPQAARVTALVAAGGRLLVGTFDCGLFEYDGATFTREFQRVSGNVTQRITTLAVSGTRIYVGSFDSGLFEWREGSTRRITEANGLPSDRVTAIDVDAPELLVGTDRGIARLDANGEAELVNGTANVTGLVSHASETWLSSLTAGVTRLDTAETSLVTRPASLVRSTATVAGAAGFGLKVEDGVVWSTRDDGLFASVAEAGAVRFERFDEPDENPVGLHNGHVSALALDGSGRLWAGGFDGGVDLIDARSGAGLTHVGDEAVAEVNSIAVDNGGQRVWVGSSRGLTLFENGAKIRTIGEKDGLVSSNVAGIAMGSASSDRTVTVATSQGVSVIDGQVTRSITAFHGLPSNHTYCIAAGEGKTYVGTLAGLVQLNGMKVERIFSMANSVLPHNWVNALAMANGRVYVGTYGGGVAVLLPGGDLRREDATAGLEVNPGAMTIAGDRLFVGTLRSGAWMLDFASGRWTKVEAVLSSDNVTAIVADDRYVFFGTENGITRIERRRLGMGESE